MEQFLEQLKIVNVINSGMVFFRMFLKQRRKNIIKISLKLLLQTSERVETRQRGFISIETRLILLLLNIIIIIFFDNDYYYHHNSA